MKLLGFFYDGMRAMLKFLKANMGEAMWLQNPLKATLQGIHGYWPKMGE